MATISDLRSAIVSWTGTNTTVLPNATCDLFVNSAMAYLQRQHRFRGQEATTGDLTYTASSGSLTLASLSITDFIEETAVYLKDASQTTPSSQLTYVERIPRDEWVEKRIGRALVDQQYPQVALPGSDTINQFLYAIWDERIFLFPTPSTAQTLVIDYFALLPDLSDSNTSNFFSTRYPDVLRLGALAEAYEYLHEDERALVYRQRFEQAIQRAVSDDTRLRSSGGSKVRGA